MKFFIISFFTIILLPQVAEAQQIQFAPKGAYWIYENEGADKSIKTIRMERLEDTTIIVLTNPRVVAKLHLSYLDSSGAEVFADDYLVKADKPGSNVYIWDSFPGYGWKPIFIPFFPLHAPSGSQMYVDLYNAFDPSYQNDLKHFIRFDTTTFITINGVELRRYDIRELYTTGQMPQECMQVCSPIIERIGSIGYFVPLNLCTQDTDTIYAGKLLSYYDPEIGVFNIPDSLRGPCSFAQPDVGIFENQKNEPTVKVYPNPAINMLHFEGSAIMNGRIRIFNLLGKECLVQVINNSQSTTLPVGDLSSGVYFYRLETDDLKAGAAGTFIKK